MEAKHKPTYKLGETVTDWSDPTTNLGVIMQPNLKFDQLTVFKKDKATRSLGAIKHILKPQEG